MKRKYVLIILFFVFLTCTLYFGDGMPAAALNSGPYESRTVKVEKCAKWSEPIDKNPTIFLYMELYNTTTKHNLLRGNVTVLTDCKNEKMKFKAFFWEQGKWKLVYVMGNIGCNSMFLPILARVTGVKYDQKNCILFKGKYLFEGEDSNKTQHMFASVQDYGRIKWRIEIFSQAGSAVCWELETVVVPLGTMKNLK